MSRRKKSRIYRAAKVIEAGKVVAKDQASTVNSKRSDVSVIMHVFLMYYVSVLTKIIWRLGNVKENHYF